MTYTAKPTGVRKFDGDTLIVLTFGAKDDFFSLAAAEGFEGLPGELSVVHPQGYSFSRVIVAGLGKKSDLTVAKLEAAVAAAARRAQALGGKRVGCVLTDEIANQFGSSKAAEAIVVGAALGCYTFTRHKSDQKKEEKKKIEECIVLTSAGRLAGVSQGVAEGKHISSAVAFARDLVNEPPSVTTPSYLSEVARTLAKASPRVTCEIFGKSEITHLGMGGLLGIARGASAEQKFIKLAYQGGGRKTIVLVGKGITFDTGGLSLKPPEHMETMKLDMAGAAAILGIFSALPALAPEVNVVGLIPATENMPGPDAVKPGDVVTIMNGKTVEILNTDAEGRMVLADALSYATAKMKPDVIIDFATLTGACMVALGQDIAGLFANDEKLMQRLTAAALSSGEMVWHMPLAEEYRELLKSPIADLKNISSGKYGGAITAALFLSEFVDGKVPWAHIDIAGPAFAEKDLPLAPRGGTGFGVRLALEYLKQL